MSGAGQLPHQAADAREAWAEEWDGLLRERDRLGCLQSGLRGPPFSHAATSTVAASQLLPWNWFSLAGTGWCYDADRDELDICSRMKDLHIAWDGIAHRIPQSDWTFLRILRFLLVLVVCSIAPAIFAYSDWKASVHDQGEYVAHSFALRRWLGSSHALPWSWSRECRRLWHESLAISLLVWMFLSFFIYVPEGNVS